MLIQFLSYDCAFYSLSEPMLSKRKIPVHTFLLLHVASACHPYGSCDKAAVWSWALHSCALQMSYCRGNVGCAKSEQKLIVK